MRLPLLACKGSKILFNLKRRWNRVRTATSWNHQLSKRENTRFLLVVLIFFVHVFRTMSCSIRVQNIIVQNGRVHTDTCKMHLGFFFFQAQAVQYIQTKKKRGMISFKNYFPHNFSRLCATTTIAPINVVFRCSHRAYICPSSDVWSSFLTTLGTLGGFL